MSTTDQIPNNKNDLINLEIKAENQIWKKETQETQAGHINSVYRRKKINKQ